MTQIVESLFGVSPERYQEQKAAALQQEALAYAQLNPMQRAEAGIYAGARQLGSGIGRMLGGEDPGMRRVTEQDQIIRSINLNDPETYGPAAQRASQMGHTELAMKILQAGETAFQRRENQNIDEVFRKYRGGAAAAAAPVPTPTPTPMAADLPTFDSMQPNVGAETFISTGVGDQSRTVRATRLNPTTGEVEPVPLRENQAAEGLFDTGTKTYSPTFGTLVLTAPQILIRLNNKLAALTDNPPEGMTPQMREQMIAATKEDITRLTPAAMAPQAAPSAAPAPVASAIGLEGKLEKLLNERRIFASQRPTRPGDVSRVTNTIKDIDEEIKRLTETNSPLAKLIADRDKYPPGDPRRKPFDAAIEKETQITDRTITIGNRVLDAKTMKVLYTAPDAPPAAIAEWTAFQAMPKNQQDSFLRLQAAKRPSTTINLPNEGERKAATLANRLNFSVDQINQAIGVDPTAAMPNTSVEIARFLSRSEMIPNQMTSAQRQIVESAQLDILDAALTLGTGAAYTQAQLEGYRKSYFPQIGDKPENVTAKRARLQNILRSAEIASGRAKVPTPIPESGASLSSIITAPPSK